MRFFHPSHMHIPTLQGTTTPAWLKKFMETHSKKFRRGRGRKSLGCQNQPYFGFSADRAIGTSSRPDQSEQYSNQRHISNFARHSEDRRYISQATSTSNRTYRIKNSPFELSQDRQSGVVHSSTNPVSSLDLCARSSSLSQYVCQPPHSSVGSHCRLDSFQCTASHQPSLSGSSSSSQSLPDLHRDFTSDLDNSIFTPLSVPSKHHTHNKSFLDSQSVYDEAETTFRSSMKNMISSQETEASFSLIIKTPNENETLHFRVPTPSHFQLHACERKNFSASKSESIARGNKTMHEALYRTALIPSSWLHKPMSLQQLSKFRASSFATGSPVDKLSFKILYQIILSPVFGISENALPIISEALTTLPHLVTSPETVVISGKNLPPQLEDLLQNALSDLFGNHAVESTVDLSDSEYYQHFQPGKSDSGHHSTAWKSNENQSDSFCLADKNTVERNINLMEDTEDCNESAFRLLADNIRYCFESVFVKQTNLCSARKQRIIQVLRGHPFTPQRIGALSHKNDQFDTADYICVDPLYQRIMRWMHPDYADPCKATRQ